MQLIYAIDDCPATLMFYEWVLKSKYKVATFTDGVKALEAIQLVTPDLVICDLCMPWMSGYEVIRKIREYNPALPIIIATCLEGEEHSLTAAAEGCVYWFKCNKHHELEELVSCTLTK